MYFLTVPSYDYVVGVQRMRSPSIVKPCGRSPSSPSHSPSSSLFFAILSSPFTSSSSSSSFLYYNPHPSLLWSRYQQELKRLLESGEEDSANTKLRAIAKVPQLRVSSGATPPTSSLLPPPSPHLSPPSTSFYLPPPPSASFHDFF